MRDLHPIELKPKRYQLNGSTEKSGNSYFLHVRTQSVVALCLRQMKHENITHNHEWNGQYPSRNMWVRDWKVAGVKSEVCVFTCGYLCIKIKHNGRYCVFVSCEARRWISRKPLCDSCGTRRFGIRHSPALFESWPTSILYAETMDVSLHEHWISCMRPTSVSRVFSVRTIEQCNCA